ncbi:transcription elongation factor, mitochondrial [Pelobates cultripes]|uniref:Transcription elongation factor, mitochondrial n=1 Tax=Pelobates cultripes TaxID=61616 RepID=A0AAD1TTD8_PELCU|nr:transcription elongation factor, mitochondrial [Pelobates cultripes]
MIRSLQFVLRAGKTLLWQPSPTQRSLHCSQCLQKSTVNMSWKGNAAESEPGGDNGKISFNDVYTEEEADTILHVLNTASEVELSGIKLLRGKKSSSIVQYRQENGPFLDLDSLVNVPYFQSKITMKVFESILHSESKDHRKERKTEVKATSKLIKPGIPADRLDAAESIVSIVFGTQKIAWAHVDRKMTVLAWDQEDWHRFMKGIYHSHIYWEDVSGSVYREVITDYSNEKLIQC